MKSSRKEALILLAIFVVSILLSSFYILKTKNEEYFRNDLLPSPIPTPQEKVGIQTNPTPKESEYTIFLVGDSMTHAMGPHGAELNQYLNTLYKNTGRGILIDNYAEGGTNILDLKKQMTTPTTYWDSTFSPLLSRKFDVIIIESFGYNPLSGLPIKEGLEKQNQALFEAVRDVRTSHPNAKIVFLATIAPNKEMYASKINPDTTQRDRELQAEERIAYIKNHIEYARKNNIPLINVYEKSIGENGDGNLKYINPDDYIHPSAEGVIFISREIADYIYKNNLLPH